MNEMKLYALFLKDKYFKKEISADDVWRMKLDHATSIFSLFQMFPVVSVENLQSGNVMINYIPFCRLHEVAFVSHRWLKKDVPDHRGRIMNFIKTTYPQTYPKYLWIDFLCQPVKKGERLDEVFFFNISAIIRGCGTFLCLVTDDYKERVWCVFEVLMFKYFKESDTNVIFHSSDRSSNRYLYPLSQRMSGEITDLSDKHRDDLRYLLSQDIHSLCNIMKHCKCSAEYEKESILAYLMDSW